MIFPGIKKTQGFTLIELLVVMMIIAILTGIIIGVAGNVRKSAAIKRAQGEVAALDLALERYKIDNGDYPSWSNIALSGGVYKGSPTAYATALIDAGGSAGNHSLFEQLVGRRTYASTTTGTQYFEVKEGQCTTSGSDAFFTDPFGYAYGYYYKYDGAIPGASSTTAKSLFNEVVPDIWSTSGEASDVATTSSGDGKAYARYLNWTANWPNK